MEKIFDNKVWLRLIPRIEPTTATKDKGAKSFFHRAAQKLILKPSTFNNAERQYEHHRVLGKLMWKVKNNLVYRGFVFKPFQLKQIDQSSSVKPTHEELQNFSNTLINGITNADDGEPGVDDKKVEQVIKKAMM